MNLPHNSLSQLPLPDDPEVIKEEVAQLAYLEISNQEKPATLFDFYLCCSNCMYGTGLLWSPYSFRSGALVAPIVNIICASLTMIAMYIQFDVSSKVGCYTFDQLWEKIIGPRFKIIPDVLLLFTSISATISDLNLILQSFRALFGPISADERDVYRNTMFLCVVVFTLGILPFCFMKYVRQTTYPSAFGMIFVFIYLIYNLYIFGGSVADRGGIDPSNQIMVSDKRFLMISFVNSFLSYHYQPIIFPIINEMDHPKTKLLIWTAWAVVLTGFVVNMICGLFGYFTLYDLNDGKIFLEYFRGNQNYFTGSKPFNNLLYVVIVLNLFCTMPTYFFAANNSIYSLLSSHPSLEWWIPPLIRAGFGLICAFLASIEGIVFKISLFLMNVSLLILTYVIIPVFYLLGPIEKSKPIQIACIIILILAIIFFILTVYYEF